MATVARQAQACAGHGKRWAGRLSARAGRTGTMHTSYAEGQRGRTPQELSRRRFLHGTTATAGLLTLGRRGWGQTASAPTAALPPPAASGIEHIVLVTMENRSFDHFLGWLPNADGRQEGLSYLDRTGVPYMTHRLAPDFQGCGH